MTDRSDRTTDNYSAEEIDRRARELARRVMSNPYVKQEWPKKAKATNENDKRAAKQGA